MAKRLAVYLGIIILLVILPYLLSLVFMRLGVYRLNAMGMSAFVAPFIAWMIFPLYFWRPFSLRVVLISIACVFLGYGVAAILVIANIALPYRLAGSYGYLNVLIYSTLPAIFFEWVNRIHLRRVFPNKALQRTDR